MDVQAEVDGDEAVRRITAVARRSACPLFLDLLWGDSPRDLLAICANPGVLFESPRRCLVFQYISGELRYYAAGWCPDQNRLHLEQDRIEAEGWELGVFATVRDALAFAEQYLVEERAIQAIEAPSQIRHSCPTAG